MKLKEALELYIAAAKVGALTFGGGYAMLPIIQREMVDSKGWNTEEEIMDYYALAQCLPGIIMVNTMAFLGEKKGGRLGAVIASLGAVTPSLIIIIIIASLLTRFADIAAVQHAFMGIRVCVTVLIFNAILKMWKTAVIDIPTIIIFIVVAIGSLLLPLSPIIYVLLAAIAGIAISTAKKDGKNAVEQAEENSKEEVNNKAEEKEFSQQDKENREEGSK